MQNFDGFGLSPSLNSALAKMNYETPTDIQAQTIPLALEGHDVMGTAQTGTGKTAAFAIPLIERLLTNPRGSALVLTPTRELGKQIMDIMNQLLGNQTRIKTAFIIGGEPMGKQLNQLRARPRLIVGTPGRINDHLERGSMMLHDTNFLVLDETDRMLDMGFSIQLEKIFKFMPQTRQTLMFSATLPKNILKLAEKFMNNPKRVAIGETNVVATKIKQEVIRIEQGDKYKELKAQLKNREGSVIIFTKTKGGADKMAINLRKDGFTSEALHGDLRQSRRDKVMQNFRKKNFRVMVATDIAARGLDVPHIEHVINYDLPQVAEDFIHRMGRTARAGAEGSAISFVSHQDGRKWAAIERLLDPDAPRGKGGDSANSNKKPRRNSNNKNKSRFRGKPGDKQGAKPGRKPEGKQHKSEGKPGNKIGGRPGNNKNAGKPTGKASGKPGDKPMKRSEGDKPKSRSGGKDAHGGNAKSGGFKPKSKGKLSPQKQRSRHKG